MCSICYDNFGDDKIMIVLENCDHLFCGNCLKHYVKNAVDENKFPILCPDPQCKAMMNQADVESVLDSVHDIDKCRNRQMKHYGETHGDVQWCPTPDCPFMFAFEEGDDPKLNCELCNHKYCLKCRHPWHEGMTCEAARVNSNHGEADR